MNAANSGTSASAKQKLAAQACGLRRSANSPQRRYNTTNTLQDRRNDRMGRTELIRLLLLVSKVAAIAAITDQRANAGPRPIAQAHENAINKRPSRRVNSLTNRL